MENKKNPNHQPGISIYIYTYTVYGDGSKPIIAIFGGINNPLNHLYVCVYIYIYLSLNITAIYNYQYPGCN